MPNVIILQPLMLYPSPFLQAIVEVDTDVAAERLVIIDRITLQHVHNQKINHPITRLMVPIKYSIGNNLIVGILDDNAVYDCKFVDGVQAELVDANTVDMSQ